MLEGDVRPNKTVQTPLYVTVPEGCYRFEVPYGLNVQMRTALRLRFLTMVNTPYRDEETPCRRGAIAYALWSTFLSQWVRNAAHALTADASTSEVRSRLWWLPPALGQA